MRIIGHIDHPVLKISIFKLDNKLAVKFETDLNEQTYKFRVADNLSNAEDVKALIDKAFIDSVEIEMKKMARLRNTAMAKRIQQSAEKDEFDEII